ncbi:hypothetical protein HER32_01740 [Hymenobacter sp. BT18]|uniref:hypothetical protein n=1 Tax=Hymenobacter sp. BT18 TaxID=2835648 RepID=UPI00143E75DF|nr:hypothetical protein [Hymenobacter sp. BT18]QIX59978.1 hypothetical protein HER32_01740 [Hymenobacter sp. BT18]
MTVQEILLHLKSSDTEEKLHAFEELYQLAAMPELYEAVVENLASMDDRVQFASLSIIIKKFPTQLQRDAKKLTPLLLHLLVASSSPVTDRAIWALTITGENSIHALIRSLTTTNDDLYKEGCIWALGRNGHIRQHPTLVVDTLRAFLHSTNPRLQYAALIALMDMSPLRPFKRLSATDYNFTVVYDEEEVIAQSLLRRQVVDAHWPKLYLELLRNR